MHYTADVTARILHKKLMRPGMRRSFTKLRANWRPSVRATRTTCAKLRAVPSAVSDAAPAS